MKLIRYRTNFQSGRITKKKYAEGERVRTSVSWSGGLSGEPAGSIIEIEAGRIGSEESEDRFELLLTVAEAEQLREELAERIAWGKRANIENAMNAHQRQAVAGMIADLNNNKPITFVDEPNAQRWFSLVRVMFPGKVELITPRLGLWIMRKAAE